MSGKRRSGTGWQRASVPSPALVALAVALPAIAGGFACTPYPTLKPDVTIDCTAESAYEFDPNAIDVSMTYEAFDGTVGSSELRMPAQPITDGSVCGASTALYIQASHFNDWGMLVGFYGFPVAPRDESAYGGLSFWARAPGASGKSFTIALDDPNTFVPDPDGGAKVNCVSYTFMGDGGNQGPPMNSIDPMTGMPISGTTTSAPPPDACGNSYSTPVVVTGNWALYTIPFSRFKQSAMPSRVPNAKLMQVGMAPGTSLLTNRIMLMVLRMPREVNTELWLAKMSFYRDRTGGSTGDAGTDTPRM